MGAHGGRGDGNGTEKAGEGYEDSAQVENSCGGKRTGAGATRRRGFEEARGRGQENDGQRNLVCHGLSPLTASFPALCCCCRATFASAVRGTPGPLGLARQDQRGETSCKLGIDASNGAVA